MKECRAYTKVTKVYTKIGIELQLGIIETESFLLIDIDFH